MLPNFCPLSEISCLIQAFVEGLELSPGCINPNLSSCYSARKGVILQLLTGRNKVIQRVKRMIIFPRGVLGVAPHKKERKLAAAAS